MRFFWVIKGPKARAVDHDSPPREKCRHATKKTLGRHLFPLQRFIFGCFPNSIPRCERITLLKMKGWNLKITNHLRCWVPAMKKNPGFFRGVGRLVDLCELGPAGGYPDVTEYAEILPSKVIFGPPPKNWWFVSIFLLSLLGIFLGATALRFRGVYAPKEQNFKHHFCHPC